MHYSCVVGVAGGVTRFASAVLLVKTGPVSRLIQPHQTSGAQVFFIGHYGHCDRQIITPEKAVWPQWRMSPEEGCQVHYLKSPSQMASSFICAKTSWKGEQRCLILHQFRILDQVLLWPNRVLRLDLVHLPERRSST